MPKEYRETFMYVWNIRSIFHFSHEGVEIFFTLAFFLNIVDK